MVIRIEKGVLNTMKPVQVGAGVWIDGQKVFMCQRRRDQKYAYQWEFPGGKMEGHETPTEAIKREWLEELGVVVDVGEYIIDYEYPYPENTVHLHFWQITGVAGGVCLDQFADADWVRIDELRARNLIAGDIMCVRELEVRWAGME